MKRLRLFVFGIVLILGIITMAAITGGMLAKHTVNNMNSNTDTTQSLIDRVKE